jgi:D-alanyl-D-alanine endopeptidase (penicillin-binding protein 7)
MTALVALDTGYALDRPVPLNRRWTTVLPKRSYSRKELLTAMLIRSDNSAAETLAGDYPGGREEFIIEMNDRARRLGMTNTRFEDASGLSANNVTTAEDMVLLLGEAVKYPFIREVSTVRQTEIIIPNGRKSRADQHVIITNTNSPLLGTFDNAILSKTGLTSRAGWCVAMVLEHGGQRYFVVVLGAKNKAQRTRLVEQTVRGRLGS